MTPQAQDLLYTLTLVLIGATLVRVLFVAMLDLKDVLLVQAPDDQRRDYLARTFADDWLRARPIDDPRWEMRKQLRARRRKPSTVPLEERIAAVNALFGYPR